MEVEDWETAAWYAAVLGMDVLADACIDASPKDGPFRKEWVDGVRARAMGEV